MTNTARPTVAGTAPGGRQAHRGTRHVVAVRRHLRLPVVRRRRGDQRRDQAHVHPAGARLGKRIRVKVTASLADATSASTTSAATPAVAPGVLTATAPPVVSGSPQVGVQVSTTSSTWSPSASRAYQWLADGTPITGATQSVFTPTAEQVGAKLTVRVTATRAGYTTATSTSAASAAIQPGAFAAVSPPTVTGTAQVDQPLTASAGTWSPSADPAYQWLVDGAPVAGATGPSYTPAAADLRKQVAVQVTVTQARLHARHGHLRRHRRGRPGNVPEHQRPLGLRDAAGRRTAERPAGRLVTRADVQLPVVGGRHPDRGRHLEHVHPHGRPGQPDTVGPGDRPAAGLPHRGHRRSHHGRGAAGHQLRGDGPGHLGTADRGSDAHGILRDLGGAAEQRSPTSGTPTGWPSRAPPRRPSRLARSPARPADQRRGDRHRRRLRAEGRELAGHRSGGARDWRPSRSRRGITGARRVGRVLTADPGTFTPSTATATYQWLRSGQPIAGATAQTYLLRAADVGHRLSVRVTLAAPHWAPATGRAGTGTRIKSVPQIRVRTSAHDTWAGVVDPGRHPGPARAGRHGPRDRGPDPPSDRRDHRRTRARAPRAPLPRHPPPRPPLPGTGAAGSRRPCGSDVRIG